MQILNSLKLTVLALCLLTSLVVAGQTLQITGTNFPSLPATSCTNTPLDISVQLGCANAVHNANTVSISGSTITVAVDYSLGPICLPAIVSSVHNVNLGMLPAGNYSVVVNGVLNGSTVSSLSNSLSVNSCCSAVPSFTASRDSVCVGDSIYFTNTSVGDSSQLWYENNIQISNQAAFGKRFNTAGSYQLKLVVTNGSCSDSITKVILVSNPPMVEIGSDTLLCAGSSITLDAGFGHDSIRWSDQSNARHLIIDTGGIYFVTVYRNYCSSSDTIEVNFQNFIPVDLGLDTSLCIGDTLNLSVFESGASYLWSNNHTGSSQEITGGQSLWVRRTTAAGCESFDTISVALDSCYVALVTYSSEKDWQVFPNPSQGGLHLSLPAVSGEQKLSIYSASGIQAGTYLFKEGEQPYITIDAPPGVYWLVLELPNHKVLYKRLLKQ